MNLILLPRKAVFYLLTFFGVSWFGATLITWLHPLAEVDENQILYLYSTSAQVLAAIYGLTLAGFVFLRTELSREEFEDPTLLDSVEALKGRYFSLLMLITGLVILTLALCNLAIVTERGSSFSAPLNVTQAAYFTSLIAIAYFIFDILRPDRLRIASKKLQDQIDPSHRSGRKGDISSFLRAYNRLEDLLKAASGEIGRIGLDYSERPKHLSNARLAEIAQRREIIGRDLLSRIRNLIQLRNSIIHGADPEVSAELVAEAERVAEEFEKAVAAFRNESNERS